MHKPGKLFIVSAPSGAGKTSVVTRAVALLAPYKVGRAVTYTTKQPRIEEVDGKDYHFITEPEFEKKIKEGFFVEYSTAYGYYYGTPRLYIDDLTSGRSWILIIDRAGAKQIFKEVPSAVSIWLYTDDLETLKNRLELRNGESAHEIEKRLKLAEGEISDEQRDSLYAYHIVNRVFELTVTEISSIIQHELSIENQVEITKKIKSHTFEI